MTARGSTPITSASSCHPPTSPPWRPPGGSTSSMDPAPASAPEGMGRRCTSATPTAMSSSSATTTRSGERLLGDLDGTGPRPGPLHHHDGGVVGEAAVVVIHHGADDLPDDAADREPVRGVLADEVGEAFDAE